MAKILIVVALCALTGCYSTRYTNLEGPPGEPEASRDLPNVPEGYTMKNGWQHFYIYGWAPGKRTYPLDQICGDGFRLKAINTKRTFVEGLVAAFAGYYINIYSPYNATFDCVPDKRDSAAAETPSG